MIINSVTSQNSNVAYTNKIDDQFQSAMPASSASLRVGSGDEEAADLDLPLVVEAQHADVAVGVGLLALLNLTQHLGGVVASEHGQLPHGPVAPIVVAGALEVSAGDGAHLVELQARDEVLTDHVFHLLGDGVIGQGGQVRQGLKLNVVVRVPHLPPKSGIRNIRNQWGYPKWTLIRLSFTQPTTLRGISREPTLLFCDRGQEEQSKMQLHITFGGDQYLHALHAAAVLDIAQLLGIAGEDGGSLETGEGLHAAGLRGSDAG